MHEITAGAVQSISEVQAGFVKAPESVFGEPHPSRRKVKEAHRIVVKVRLNLLLSIPFS